MKKKDAEKQFANLPQSAADYIKLVIKKMGYRRKVRQDVAAELIAHFEDALADCKDDKEKEEKSQKLIADFGDPKLLAILTRRAKKRCRPMWQKILIHGFQAFGIFILYLIICSTPLFIGRPTIKTSYLDLLNATIQKGPDPCENAQLYYDKAAQLLPEDTYGITAFPKRWPGDFNDTQREELAKWLAASKPALELFRLGAQKPWWPVYDANLSDEQRKELYGRSNKAIPIVTKFSGIAASMYELNAILSNEMPSLSQNRNLASRMSYQILYEVYTGDVNAAISDCISLHTFAQQKEANGLIIQQMVGVAIDAMGIQCVFTIMEKTDLSPQLLLKLENEYEQSVALRRPVIDFDSEKVVWLDTMQRSFTDDGKGDGRMLKDGLLLMVTTPQSSAARFLTMRFPSRRETLTKINTLFENAKCKMQKTPWQLHQENDVNIPNSGIMLLDIMVPAFAELGTLSWRLNCQCKAVITTAAILRYKKEKDTYPSNLEELVTIGYLKQLPMDPYSDKSLVYKKTDNNFILYSVSNNFVDDGGTAGSNGMWSDDGDAIFWPVEKPKPAKITGRPMPGMPGMGQTK